MEQATFAAGCFWGVEELFRTTKGVLRTIVGYAGGTMANPTYEQVCSDKTGHAEAVHMEFDPSIISYEKLLEIFFANHDPTTPNRQGPDRGTQYRSVIFYHTYEQKAKAEQYVRALSASGKYHRPIVTEIVPAKTFYPAEEYHQKYLMKKGASSCHI